MSASDSEAGDALKEFTADANAAGERIDQWLAACLAPDLSRSRVQALIRDGQVTVNGSPAREPKRRLAEGDRVALSVPEPEPAEPLGEDIPLQILYEDDDLIVIDKPAGLVVHPGAGNWTGTLVNALIHHCGASLSGVGGVRRPGIVHRLDKDTSGLMVVAKTDRAHRGRAEQFAAHGRDGKLTRAYKALVWGVPSPKRGTVDANIARSSHNRMKMAALKPRTRRDDEEDDDNAAGRRAITHYEVERVFADGLVSLVECRLETGRTHQIRVHMTHIGHPVLGDPTYGTGMKTRASKLAEPARAALARLNRQALHAWHLGFEHPVTGERLDFNAPLPEDMEKLVNELTV